GGDAREGWTAGVSRRSCRGDWRAIAFTRIRAGLPVAARDGRGLAADAGEPRARAAPFDRRATAHLGECPGGRRVFGAFHRGGVRDLRQGPRSGGTTFNLLHYLTGAPEDSVRARAWWRDGPHAFVDAVQALARQQGALVRTGAAVARILVRDDAVSGVVLANG